MRLLNSDESGALNGGMSLGWKAVKEASKPTEAANGTLDAIDKANPDYFDPRNESGGEGGGGGS